MAGRKCSILLRLTHEPHLRSPSLGRELAPAKEHFMTLPKVISLPPAADARPIGDARGAYGYGRPAHGSDPQARYHFEPGQGGTPETQELFDAIAKVARNPVSQ